ncbi:MAG: TraK domain-containing protein [bacterium]
MWKKILILSVSLCLIASSAYAGILTNKEQIKQTPKQNKEQIKQIKYVRYAKLFGVELNYNTLSATLSFIPAGYKYDIKGRLFSLTVPNVLSIMKKPVGLPVLNSNAVRKAYYSYNKHTLTVSAVLRKRFRKNRIKVMSEGHIIVIKFPALKNRPVLSFPASPRKVNKHSYSVKNSKTVYVSLKNITMVTTPYPIAKIIYSKDQNIEISKSLNTAFVKILPLEEQKPSGRIKFLYSSMPRDIYIITPAGTYSLNLIPRHIPSLTVMLKNPQIPNNASGVSGKRREFKQPVLNSGISANVSYYRSSVYTNKLANLIKDAYFFKIPSGFSSFALKKTYRFKQITIKGLNAWVSAHLIVLDYLIKANTSINLSEKEFLWMSPNPLAISIVSPVLKQGENTRLFIVEGSNGR